MKPYPALLAAAALFTNPSQAQSCIGNCGTATPNGVVVAPPGGSLEYTFISTFNSELGAGQISGVGGGGAGATGSEYTTRLFAVDAGDTLSFSFNYVTSDAGSSVADYSFAQLLNGGEHAAWLFSARSSGDGFFTPGFGLPSNESTILPTSPGMVLEGPEWDQLGGWSQSCWDAGCGYTGWITSNYSFSYAGNYSVRFGVTNYGDDQYDSGLAFTDVTIRNESVGAVPEPTTWVLMLLGFGAIGSATRAQKRRARLPLGSRLAKAQLRPFVDDFKSRYIEPDPPR